MDQESYLRERLEKASRKRGRIAMIAREAEIDQRTVRAVLKASHSANPATLDKLSAYFKKEDRRAKP